MKIRRLATPYAIVAALAAGAADVSAEQPSKPARSEKTSTDRVDEELQLKGVEDTLRMSEGQRRKIELEVESLRADRTRLSAALIQTTQRVQAAERSANEARTKLEALGAKSAALTKSLAVRREAIAGVLAVLQRMGRDPPPAILVKPGDMAEAIRAATLLGSVVPDLKRETDALAQDVHEMEETKTALAQQRDVQTRESQTLGAERLRLTGLVDARQKSLSEAEQSLGSERERADELARQASSLKDLIVRLEEKPDGDGRTKALSARPPTAERMKPTLAFVEKRGRVSLPVVGKMLKSFGETGAFGGLERGVSIASAPGATVASPADGTVVYSGSYRSYGKVLILDMGAGYTFVLAGLEKSDVTTGQFVLSGEPIAAMGDVATRTAATAAIGAAQPVLYIELRKDGTAIDPGPWWAKTDIEKAHG